MHAENEAEPIADWLRGLGIAASVLRYPLNARHPIPLDAVRSEVRRLRATGVARVGVIGFSAGGHLAGLAALSPRHAHRSGGARLRDHVDGDGDLPAGAADPARRGRLA